MNNLPLPERIRRVGLDTSTSSAGGIQIIIAVQSIVPLFFCKTKAIGVNFSAFTAFPKLCCKSYFKNFAD